MDRSLICNLSASCLRSLLFGLTFTAKVSSSTASCSAVALVRLRVGADCCSGCCFWSSTAFWQSFDALVFSLSAAVDSLLDASALGEEGGGKSEEGDCDIVYVSRVRG